MITQVSTLYPVKALNDSKEKSDSRHGGEKPSISLSLTHTHTHTHTRARAHTHTHMTVVIFMVYVQTPLYSMAVKSLFIVDRKGIPY